MRTRVQNGQEQWYWYSKIRLTTLVNSSILCNIMGNTEIQSTKMEKMRDLMLRLPGWAYDELQRRAKTEADSTGHPITRGSLGRKLLIDSLKTLQRRKN